LFNWVPAVVQGFKEENMNLDPEAAEAKTGDRREPSNASER
jgi:hypothetical protein